MHAPIHARTRGNGDNVDVDDDGGDDVDDGHDVDRR